MRSGKIRKKKLFAQAAGHACQQLLEAGNNLYTYTCDELYMASPLEKQTKKEAENWGVNIRENTDCPGPINDSDNGQVLGEESWEDEKVLGGLDREKGLVQAGCQQEFQIQMFVFTCVRVGKLESGTPPMIIM